MTKLEHANVSVRDVEGTIRFLQTAFPDFRIRGEGRSPIGARWVHVGNDDAYLALNEAIDDAPEPWVPYAGKPGLNHLGFVVDDVSSLRDRLRAAGYRDTTVPNGHPARTRVYFNDVDGSDWEFVEYHVDDRSARNDYSDA